jgi:hypothetical protein
VTESVRAAREAHLGPTTAMRIKSGPNLGDEYFRKDLPVARQRPGRAAVWLATALNETLGSH